MRQTLKTIVLIIHILLAMKTFGQHQHSEKSYSSVFRKIDFHQEYTKAATRLCKV